MNLPGHYVHHLVASYGWLVSPLPGGRWLMLRRAQPPREGPPPLRIVLGPAGEEVRGLARLQVIDRYFHNVTTAARGASARHRWWGRSLRWKPARAPGKENLRG